MDKIQSIEEWFKDNEGKWFHVATTRCDGLNTLYIDGVKRGERADGETV